ncbi:MAG: EAL domain-containing protein [Candidatus Thiodiazotropha sp.]
MQLKSRVALILLLAFLSLLTLQSFLDIRSFLPILAEFESVEGATPVGGALSDLLGLWVEQGLWRNTLLFGLGLGLVLWAVFRWLDSRLLSPLQRSRDALLTVAETELFELDLGQLRNTPEFIRQGVTQLAHATLQREAELEHQMALFTALSQTGLTMRHVSSPQLLFERVCEIAVNYGGFKAAWVGAVDGDGRVVHPIASHGIDAAHLKVCKFDQDLTDPHAEGPLAIAVFGKSPSVVEASESEAGKTTWHRLAHLSGGRSAALFPIVVKREVVATLTVYAEQSGYFTPVIQELLEGMVSNLAFAIESIERNQAHQIAIQSLEASSRQLSEVNQKMSLLLESTGEGIFGVDEQDACTFVNQAAANMLGYSRRELLEQPIHRRVRMPTTAGESFNQMVRSQGDAISVRDESFVRKNESLFPVEYSTYPILEQGVFKGSVTVFRDVTSSRAMMREMRFLATHDSLTHLLNRHAFDQRLRQAFNLSREKKAQHVLLYMDLDQFKLVNDTCGHMAGDMMLRQLAHRLRLAIGNEDVLARLGGDEFGLLLEHCDLNRANKLANQICTAVKEYRFNWEGRNYSTGMSIGIVAIGPKTESPHSALSAADAACYVAKDMGRNRVYVYQPYDEEINRQQGEMRLVNKIESAIDQQRFTLLQQPIMSLRSSAIGDEHIEVLLRMRDERGKQIMPGAFIPAAERYNIMVNLDRWVIRNTFQWLAQNPTRLEELGLCAINLSGQSLSDATLHEYILEQLREFRLPAEKISFEITETAVVSRLDQATRFISLLKRRGFRFALDDFGTGMSSFAYLKHLPVDYLKIDGSFVRNILHDRVDRAMVESINQIGHLMGLQTIAEYVENDLILEQLIEIGVDYVQGYGVVRPSPLTQVGSSGRSRPGLLH